MVQLYFSLTKLLLLLLRDLLLPHQDRDVRRRSLVDFDQRSTLLLLARTGLQFRLPRAHLRLSLRGHHASVTKIVSLLRLLLSQLPPDVAAAHLLRSSVSPYAV